MQMSIAYAHTLRENYSNYYAEDLDTHAWWINIIIDIEVIEKEINIVSFTESYGIQIQIECAKLLPLAHLVSPSTSSIQDIGKRQIPFLFPWLNIKVCSQTKHPRSMI